MPSWGTVVAASAASCTIGICLGALLPQQPELLAGKLTVWRRGTDAVGVGGQLVRMPKDILDAIDAKTAEVAAAKAAGRERLAVVALVEELIQLKKEYRLVSGEEWKWTARRPAGAARQPVAAANTDNQAAAALGQTASGKKTRQKAATQNQAQKQNQQKKQKKQQQKLQTQKQKQQEPQEQGNSTEKREHQTAAETAASPRTQPTPPVTPVTPALVTLPASAELPQSARFYAAPGMHVWVIDEETRPWRVDITKGSSGRYNVSITAPTTTIPAGATGWAGVVVGSPGEKLGLWPVLPATMAANGAKVDRSAVQLVASSQLRIRSYETSEATGLSNFQLAAEPGAVHEGVMCDVSGMCPIVGNRWKKKGQDYDLCDDEYRKLTPVQQQQFVNVPVGAGMEGYSDDEETGSDSDGEDVGEPVKMMLCVNQEVYRDGKKTKMRPGKVAAQCGHATLGCYLAAERYPETSKQGMALRRWAAQGQMKITLKIPSVDVMMELQESARTVGVPHCLIRDAGHTQIDPGTKTVLALGPALASELAPITVSRVQLIEAADHLTAQRN